MSDGGRTLIQVIDNGSLAMACENTYGIESCMGLTVFIPKEKGKIYYDDKIVEPSTDKCIIYADVYRYTANRGDTRTVPKIKFENKIYFKKQNKLKLKIKIIT